MPVRGVDQWQSNGFRLRLQAAGDMVLLRTGRPDAVLTTAPGTELYDGVQLAQPVQRQLEDLLQEKQGPNAWVPLFAFQRETGADNAHVYGQIRFMGHDALFLRTSRQPITLDSTKNGHWEHAIEAAVHLQNDGFRHLGNHLGWYERHLPDRELEYKFQLQPPVDLWQVTSEGHARVGAGLLPGFFAEYGDELKRFDYSSEIYEITAPAEHVGYVAFARGPADVWIIKKKTFARDGFDRGEEIWRQRELTGGTFESELDVRGLSFRRLGAFRRQSYELHVESVATGHIFTIVVDRSTPEIAPERFMNQCEIEYVHTRSLVGTAEESGRTESIVAEMDLVRAFTEKLMTDLGIDFTSTFYSKLSFMRDVQPSEESDIPAT
ncbi:hypothetical protein KVH15_09760 [Streptomyces olivaceus]|uniref:hypothetical protein n=1 Tax=Streptomyces olivaceus TaxID=47716 RepID=UPI001CCF1BA0|nr:hypothetical protein [Streptomyces olivaceus]MBZ6081329.1 hypothetical protein [Streptomyces olivaceus]